MLQIIRKILQKLLAMLPEEAVQTEPLERDEVLQSDECIHDKSEIQSKSTPSAAGPNVETDRNLNNAELVQPEEGFILSDEQMSAFREMNHSNKNLFITGKAGTGKSVLLKYFREHTDKRIAVLAPTGIAAINVEGQTIHSFFELSPSIQTAEDFENKYYKDSNEKLMQCLDVIVIDEISMVRADVMDAIDLSLQIGRRKRGVPFGGCQIIAFGDLYQLPPVEPLDEDAKRYFQETYKTLFFFGAPAVRQNPFHIIELTQVFRQRDPVFIDVLNRIRTGEQTFSAVDQLNALCFGKSHQHDGIIVSPWKRQVKYINDTNLANLPGPVYQYQANAYGSFLKNGEIDAAKAPADCMLQLKPGAKVMMLNNDRNKHWVNGTFATVKQADQDKIVVEISGQDYNVETHIWEEYAYHYDATSGKIKKMMSGAFEQYPIRLGYAITIHKSQGQTYDKVAIDYGKGEAFACGQTYVALSRCRSLEGLWLKTPLKYGDIKVSDEVRQWMAYYLQNSKADNQQNANVSIYNHWSDEAWAIETNH